MIDKQPEELRPALKRGMKIYLWSFGVMILMLIGLAWIYLSKLQDILDISRNPL